MGKSVLGAVKSAGSLGTRDDEGMDPTQQEAIDEKMFALDGRPTRPKMGANAILGLI